MSALRKIFIPSISFLLLFTLGAFTLRGFAQYQNRYANDNANQRLWGASKVKADIKRMTKQIDLPDLPNYAGQCKFKDGYTETTDRGETVYRMTFFAKESPPEVSDWYSNTLTMYKWHFLNKAERHMSASQDDGYTVFINVHYSSEDAYKSIFDVVFRIAPKMNSKSN